MNASICPSDGIPIVRWTTIGHRASSVSIPSGGTSSFLPLTSPSLQRARVRTTTMRMTDEIETGAIEKAVARGSALLWAARRADGSSDDRSDVGPASTANVIVALDHVGLLPA